MSGNGLPVLRPELPHQFQGFSNTERRLPPRGLLHLAVVGDVDKLVTRTTLIAHVLNMDIRQLLNLFNQLQQRDGVVYASANVEDLACCDTLVLPGHLQGVEKVIDAKHVTDLPAIAVDHNRRPPERRIKEVGHPSLVFGAELSRPSDA